MAHSFRFLTLSCLFLALVTVFFLAPPTPVSIAATEQPTMAVTAQGTQPADVVPVPGKWSTNEAFPSVTSGVVGTITIDFVVAEDSRRLSKFAVTLKNPSFCGNSAGQMKTEVASVEIEGGAFSYSFSPNPPVMVLGHKMEGKFISSDKAEGTYTYRTQAGCQAVFKWTVTPVATQGTPQPTAAATMAGTNVAAAPVQLPIGVEKIAFGTAFNNQKDCDISNPLPSPVKFPAGTTQVAFQIVTDPNKIQKLVYSLDFGSDVSGLQGENCNKYAVIKGAPKQYLWGLTIKRSDGKPFKAGRYILQITANGEKRNVSFEIQ
jgi:hypothetical protein